MGIIGKIGKAISNGSKAIGSRINNDKVEDTMEQRAEDYRQQVRRGVR